MSRTRALAPRMIGRSEQFADLDAHLRQARAGSGSLVFLAGEAGVGKTRLVRAFLERAQAGKGIEILQGYSRRSTGCCARGPAPAFVS